MSYDNQNIPDSAVSSAPPRRLSLNECKASIRNQYEMELLALKIRQINKEKEECENEHRKSLRDIKESMRLVKSTTGKSEKPIDPKTLKKEQPKEVVNKNKNQRSDSVTSFNFKYELIQKQAAENNGLLYNSFPIKSLHDPLYQYNPTFLSIRDTPDISSYESSEINLGLDSKRRDVTLEMMQVTRGGFKLTLDDDDETSSDDEDYIHLYQSKNDTSNVNNINNKNNGTKKNLNGNTANNNNNNYNNNNNNNTVIAKKYEYNEFEDDKLEKMYADLRKQRKKIPHASPQKIEECIKKDPIFAKRYRQFSSAKHTGRAPIYDRQDPGLRLVMPRSAIEKKKKEMMESTEIKKTPPRENPDIEVKQKLNEKILDFVKNCSPN